MMNDSHASLRDDFQVSCPEIDLLVALTQNHEGTLGARITGAGFGGCTVALIKKDRVENYIDEIVPKYARSSSRHPEVYVCQAESGVAVANCAVRL
jgi:galactokinase